MRMTLLNYLMGPDSGVRNPPKATRNASINMLLKSEFADEVERLLGNDLDAFTDVDSVGSSSPSDWERDLRESMNFPYDSSNTFFDLDKPAKKKESHYSDLKPLVRPSTNSSLPSVPNTDFQVSQKSTKAILSFAEHKRIIKETFLNTRPGTTPSRPKSREKVVKQFTRLSELATPKQRPPTSGGTQTNLKDNPTSSSCSKLKTINSKMMLVKTYDALSTAATVINASKGLASSSKLGGTSSVGLLRTASDVLNITQNR